MQTTPMSLDALGAAPDGLDEYRIGTASEVAAVLRQLSDASAPLQLNAHASAVDATLWSADAQRGVIGFSVDPQHPALSTLQGCTELVVVGYLDNVKLQFDVARRVLVLGPNASVLNCSYPSEVLRFQRRSAYRVRPPTYGAPMARMHHTDIAEMQLALRVVDLSIGGCGLFLPDDVPTMQVGGVLNQVEIELDAFTRLRVDLRLQHVTSLNADANGVRLGCEFLHIAPTALRTLQRFIDRTQKRGMLLSVG